MREDTPRSGATPLPTDEIRPSCCAVAGAPRGAPAIFSSHGASTGLRPKSHADGEESVATATAGASGICPPKAGSSRRIRLLPNPAWRTKEGRREPPHLRGGGSGGRGRPCRGPVVITPPLPRAARRSDCRATKYGGAGPPPAWRFSPAGRVSRPAGVGTRGCRTFTRGGAPRSKRVDRVTAGLSAGNADKAPGEGQASRMANGH